MQLRVWDNTLFTSSSCKPLYLCMCVSAYVCVCMHACVLPCPQACSLSSCHPDMLDGQAKHFCHSASPSPARPSPLCQSAFQPPVTSLFLPHTNTHSLTHTDSIFVTHLHTLAHALHNQLHTRTRISMKWEASHSTEIATLQASSLTCWNQSKV